MKKVILTADQIVIPSKKVDSPPILEIYESIIARGGKDSIAPLLVTPTSIIDVDEASFSARLRVLAVLGAEYFLMDGNHRAVAHALHSEDLNALVITNDRDLESCRKMAKRGEWPNFYKIYRDSFPEVISRFRKYIRQGDDLRTLRNKVDRLVVKDGGLPDHMKNTCKGNTTIAEIRRRIKFWELALSNTSHEPLASYDVQIPKELRDNKEYIMAGDHIPLDQLSKRLRDDDDVVFKAVKADSDQIANASDRLRKNRVLTHVALSRNGHSWSVIHPVFSHDKGFAFTALYAPNSRNVFKMLPEVFQEDPEMKEEEKRARRRR